MNRGYMLGNPTPRSPFFRHGTESRAKSLTRDSIYPRSEFDLDGSLLHSPAHSQIRSSSVGGSNFYFTSPSLISRYAYPSQEDWSLGQPAQLYNMPYYKYEEADSEYGVGTVSGPVYSKASSTSGASPAKHKDLKRKMVFDLHKEIRKPIHTTLLEEISDMDRITEICMNTLKSMMESKRHRRFLHHMNNSNNVDVLDDLSMENVSISGDLTLSESTSEMETDFSNNSKRGQDFILQDLKALS